VSEAESLAKSSFWRTSSSGFDSYGLIPKTQFIAFVILSVNASGFRLLIPIRIAELK